MILTSRQDKSWHPRGSLAQAHTHTQANNEHTHAHSVRGKCSELHLASQET